MANPSCAFAVERFCRKSAFIILRLEGSPTKAVRELTPIEQPDDPELCVCEVEHAHVNDSELRKCIEKNLRICYIKQRYSNKWADGGTMGNHAKHFIIDDECYYVA